MKIGLSLTLCLFLAPWRCFGGETQEELDRSPDNQVKIINISYSEDDANGGGGYFEIRSRSGQLLYSGNPGFLIPPHTAQGILWRPDSKFVAICYEPFHLSLQTEVICREGQHFVRVEMLKDAGPIPSAYSEPDSWTKDGDLILKVTTGMQTKSVAHSGEFYFVTIHFAGEPARGIKVSQTVPKPNP